MCDFGIPFGIGRDSKWHPKLPKWHQNDEQIRCWYPPLWHPWNGVLCQSPQKRARASFFMDLRIFRTPQTSISTILDPLERCKNLRGPAKFFQVFAMPHPEE